VYKGFKELARKNKKRFVVIDGRNSIQKIHSEIIRVVALKLKNFSTQRHGGTEK
jgi:thymidylate kinase